MSALFIPILLTKRKCIHVHCKAQRIKADVTSQKLAMVKVHEFGKRGRAITH